MGRGRSFCGAVRVSAKSADDVGRDEPAAWLIPAQADQAAADKLAGVLAEHGVEVFRAQEEVRVCGGAQPAGTYLVPLAQPAQTLIMVTKDLPTPQRFPRRPGVPAKRPL